MRGARRSASERRRHRLLRARRRPRQSPFAAGERRDRVHRRDGLLAQRRRRERGSRARCCPRSARALAARALLHRRRAARRRRCRRWRGCRASTSPARVPDVRPYLRTRRVVVAPLRIARGIQNKVLEAMAMATPGGRVAAGAGRHRRRCPGVELMSADDAAASSRARSRAAGAGARRRASAAARARARWRLQLGGQPRAVRAAARHRRCAALRAGWRCAR